jgi:hypothetical protein
MERFVKSIEKIGFEKVVEDGVEGALMVRWTGVLRGRTLVKPERRA